MNIFQFDKAHFGNLSLSILACLVWVPVVLAGAPTATITLPADGILITKGTSIFFEGSGYDPEDGPLTGKNLVWMSDREGPLGSGERFGCKLSQGTHVITLEAKDKAGETGQTRVTVTVDK